MNCMKRISLASLSVIVLASGAVGGATAQPYPNKPIKLVVSVAAGGTPDVIARAVADRLLSQLGQAVIVDNRPGAGQTIGLKAVANADPDGYTLLLGVTGNLAINPALYKNLDFSPSKGLVPVALVATIPNVLVVASTVPANTVAELIAYAKANPGKLSHGASLGTPPHLLGEFFRAKTGTDIVYVPYKGGAQAMPDLLGGRIQTTADTPSMLLPYIQQGKLRPLAVTSVTRLPELPDVPTLAELGIDGYPPQTWMGIVAPAGTPDAIVSKLNSAVNDVLRSAETKASLAKLGFKEQPGSPQDFAALIATDVEKWAAVVTLSGAKGD
jgi:tripartite-type tricarboxylate transporter receptor subunit TctC